jgi:hypothetical protein
VARVVIEPGAALLTQAGEQRTLVARAYDADGNPVDATFTWSSSRAASVSVDSDGVLTARAATGSAQIVARAGGVPSQPALALVAQPVAGALLVGDDQVVGDPEETDPGAAPSLANTYRVTLQGVAAPAVGKVVIGTGGKPVAGRVVAVRASGSRQVVTLQPLPVNQLFAALELRERFDLSQAEVRYPDDVLARFDVQRDGNRYVFTERPGTRQLAVPRKRAQAATGTFVLPPFGDCEASSPFDEVPLSVDGPLSFAVTLSPDYEIEYSVAGGLKKLLLQADPKLEMTAAVEMKIATEATFGCKLTLFQFVVPTTGPMSWIASGLVPVGIGFEVGGEITVAGAEIAGKVVAQGEAKLGIDCASGSCGVVNSFAKGPVEVEPSVQLPSLGTDPRVEPSLSLFTFVELNIGNPLLQSLQFGAFEAKLAGTLSGSFATRAVQIADTGYRANYGASIDLEAGAGVGLEDVLDLFDLDDLVTLEFTESLPLAASPGGSVAADKASFVAGDPVNFKVEIKPATAAFIPSLGAPYNVERILIVRKLPANVVEIGSVTASAGQTNFTIPWTATTSGKADEFYAFVVTKLLPSDLLALELGQASGAAAAEVRLERGYISRDNYCQARALSESETDPADSLYDDDEDEDGNASFSCSAGVAGVGATASGGGTIDGAEFAPVGDETGPLLSTLEASASGNATMALSVSPQDGRYRQAYVGARGGGSGNWLLHAGDAPVAYTLTATLTAVQGGGASVELLRQNPLDPGTPDVQRAAICPGFDAAPGVDDWSTVLESICDAAENVGAKSVTFTGVLQPKQNLELSARASGGWAGSRTVSASTTQGPTGSKSASASFDLKLEFSVPP